MPEIAEVALMVDAIREIMSGQRLSRLDILGGRYLVFGGKDQHGRWVRPEEIETDEDGQPIFKADMAAGQHLPGLAGYEQLSAALPLKIESINVKGKFCWLALERNWYITITFGMSGGIYYEPTESVLSEYAAQTGKQVTRRDYMKHFHLKFVADNGSVFYFGDPRRFGTVTVANNAIDLNKKLNKLGQDMLTGSPITDAQFVRIFRAVRFAHKNICQVLMGQEAISGVGNYIKAEVLYQCRINPWALVSDLDEPTLIHLHQVIRSVAHSAYTGHGASLYTYSGTRREKGTFQDMLQVYGKNHDPLGNPVVTLPDKRSPDKRTTHYVPTVQTIGANRDPGGRKPLIAPQGEKLPISPVVMVTNHATPKPQDQTEAQDETQRCDGI